MSFGQVLLERSEVKRGIYKIEDAGIPCQADGWHVFRPRLLNYGWAAASEPGGPAHIPSQPNLFSCGSFVGLRDVAVDEYVVCRHQGESEQRILRRRGRFSDLRFFTREVNRPSLDIDSRCCGLRISGGRLPFLHSFDRRRCLKLVGLDAVGQRRECAGRYLLLHHEALAVVMPGKDSMHSWHVTAPVCIA